MLKYNEDEIALVNISYNGNYLTFDSGDTNFLRKLSVEHDWRLRRGNENISQVIVFYLCSRTIACTTFVSSYTESFQLIINAENCFPSEKLTLAALFIINEEIIL